MEMKALIERFPEQLEEAIAIADHTSIPALGEIRNIAVCGLGGSGIGGTIVSNLLARDLPIPMAVNKTYDLPAFIDENTLVIISSYSGNTEETLEAMDHAVARGAMLVAVTSGGQVADRATAEGYPVILIPGGDPPRACLGYSMIQLLHILASQRLIAPDWRTSLRAGIDLLRTEGQAIRSEAESIADRIHDKLPVLYADDRMEGVAVRWRQQLNENAKMLCWHHVVPEMNHNELVGWRTARPDWAVLFLTTDGDHPRITRRMEINRQVMERYAETIVDVQASGTDDLQRAIHLIHLGDWVSWFVSEQRGMDAMEIEVIDHLKAALAEMA